MSQYVIPSPEAVAELFETLIGKSVTPKKGKPQTPRSGLKATAAVYKHHESGDIVGACIFDFPLSVYSAAALSMIPISAVSGAVQTGQLGENLVENLQEVFNIASQLLATDDGEDHGQLAGHYLAFKDVPSDLVAKIKGAKRKIDVGLELQGYGVGNASFHLFG